MINSARPSIMHKFLACVAAAIGISILMHLGLDLPDTRDINMAFYCGTAYGFISLGILE